MMIKRSTQMELVGKGKLTLSLNDHVATGGEGSVYRKGDIGIKLYTDTGKMIRDDMPGKLNLLAQIQHPHIVGPQGLVMVGGKPAGFYMSWSSGEPLSRVFTNDWRQRESFGDPQSKILADRMRSVVQFAHDHQAVLVDPNELGWLVVGTRDPEPRILDVDSWAIGRWPATAIMPSVRDWHTKGFTALTDWFAWGITSFQVFTGIHPYKGRLDGYKPSDLEGRMRANASVFEPGVRLNRAVRDFGCIPGPLLDWYVSTFQHGERVMPPSPFDTGAAVSKAAQVKRVVTATIGLLIHDKLFEEANDPAVRIFHCGVVLLESGKLVDLASKRIIGTARSRDCEVVRMDGYWLKADRDSREWMFSSINGKSLGEEPLTLNAKGYRLLRYENRLFLVTDQGLSELSLKVLGKPILAVGRTWGVQINSTRWFDGVGIQDSMGATYVIAPFGEESCGQVRVKELDGMTPVAAKAGNRFVAVIGVDKSGNYRKVELTFDRDYRTYSVWEGGAQTPDLNLALLPKGVGVTIVDDGELAIFVPTTGVVNKVSDKDTTTDLILDNWGDTVVYLKEGGVWSLRMKT